MDARQGPVREERLVMYTHYTESSESLEGDRVRDRVQRCHFLTSFQEGPHKKLFLQGKKSFKILQVRWQTLL